MRPEPELSEPAPDARNIARAVGALAALFLVVAGIFLINSPVGDREAVRSTNNPAIATLHCGRPLQHDEDALRERRWSATPQQRDSSAVLGEDVALCLDLVGGHRDRAAVLGGVGLALAALAVLMAVRARGDVSRRRRG